MVKTLTNAEIYEQAIGINQYLNLDELNMPVKVGFYLQKNLSAIMSLGEEIDKERVKIFSKYGTFNSGENRYDFPEDKIDIINQEVNDLYSLKQEVNVYMIPLEWFDNIKLNASQIALISFMIEEGE